jgi:ribosomal protein S18 acetylase RimI-like enzyme
MDYRRFLNTDLPGIVSLWKQQRPHRALAQTMYADLFERLVLSKPWFDADGLIVADAGGSLEGLIHCGFGPVADGSDINRSTGIICLLLTGTRSDKAVVCNELISHGEKYLRDHGSQVILTGTDFPFSPFYLGLYGGSNVPGILGAHHSVIDVFRERGYSPRSTILVMQRSLHHFRSVFDRQQTTVRRNYRIEQDQDPLPRTWWEACTLGNANRSVFHLIDRKSDQVRGNISYWDVEPLARNWGVRAMGLFHLLVDEAARQAGLGTFLVSESLRHMQQAGVNLVEAQVEKDNLPAVHLFEKMGFETIDTGVVLDRSTSDSGF